jgi:antirestriction protein
MEDVATNYVEESGLFQEVPEQLQFYFDFEAYGRDMEINGSMWGKYLTYNIYFLLFVIDVLKS